MLPHPALLDLAADRPIGSVADPEALVRSAVAHRMESLLAAELERTKVRLAGNWHEQLVAVDLRSRAMYRAAEQALATTVERLGPFAEHVALYKGISVAERLFADDPEARPCVDVDLFVDPSAFGHLDEMVARLDPCHEFAGHVVELVDRRYLQVIEVRIGELLVDIHVDPMNLAVRTRSVDTVWRSTVETITNQGCRIRVADPTISFLQMTINALRDNFAQLIQVVEVARASRDPDVDIDRAGRISAAEGWDALVRESLRFVSDHAAIGDGPSTRWLAGRTTALERAALRLAAPNSKRLGGDPTWLRSRRAELLLPLAMPGRRVELARAGIDRLIPPAAVLDARGMGTRGPALLRALRYRRQQAHR